MPDGVGNIKFGVLCVQEAQPENKLLFDYSLQSTEFAVRTHLVLNQIYRPRDQVAIEIMSKDI